MRWLFVSRRRYDMDLGAVSADRERIRGERNQFAKDRDAFKYAAETSAEKFTDASIVNECLTEDLVRLRKENQELKDQAEARATVVQQRGNALGRLGNRLANAEAEYGHIDGYAARMEKRLDRALGACARYLDAYHAASRRADQLQQRYDDAVGLPAGRITDSSRWQPGYGKQRETTP